MLEGSVKEFESFQLPIMTLDENVEEEIYEKSKICLKILKERRRNYQ